VRTRATRGGSIAGCPDAIYNDTRQDREVHRVGHIAHRHVTTNRTPRNIRLGAHADPAFVHADELIWCGW
jgi:hypothetical protein